VLGSHRRQAWPITEHHLELVRKHHKRVAGGCALHLTASMDEQHAGMVTVHGMPSEVDD
jgi:hypothetical protein